MAFEFTLAEGKEPLYRSALEESTCESFSSDTLIPAQFGKKLFSEGLGVSFLGGPMASMNVLSKEFSSSSLLPFPAFLLPFTSFFSSDLRILDHVEARLLPFAPSPRPPTEVYREELSIEVRRFPAQIKAVARVAGWTTAVEFSVQAYSVLPGKFNIKGAIVEFQLVSGDGMAFNHMMRHFRTWLPSYCPYIYCGAEEGFCDFHLPHLTTVEEKNKPVSMNTTVPQKKNGYKAGVKQIVTLLTSNDHVCQQHGILLLSMVSYQSTYQRLVAKKLATVSLPKSMLDQLVRFNLLTADTTMAYTACNMVANMCHQPQFLKLVGIPQLVYTLVETLWQHLVNVSSVVEDWKKKEVAQAAARALAVCACSHADYLSPWWTRLMNARGKDPGTSFFISYLGNCPMSSKEMIATSSSAAYYY